jgi:DNA-binding CsgD family transcriptional regulator
MSYIPLHLIDELNRLFSILSNEIGKPGFCEMIAEEYKSLLHFDRIQHVALDHKDNLFLYYSSGIKEFEEHFHEYEEHDIWKPDQMEHPLEKCLLTHIRTKQFDKLASQNPLFDYLKGIASTSSMLGAIHPSRSAIVGLRSDSHDLKEEEVTLNNFLAPQIISTLSLHIKTNFCNTLYDYLDSSNRGTPFCITDRSMNLIYAHKYFFGEMSTSFNSWQALSKEIQRTLSSTHTISFPKMIDIGGKSLYLSQFRANKILYYSIEITEGVLPSVIKLTQREKSILKLVKKGLSNSEIANYFEISTETVKKHISNLFQKTNTKNRTALSRLLL